MGRCKSKSTIMLCLSNAMHFYLPLSVDYKVSEFVDVGVWNMNLLNAAV